MPVYKVWDSNRTMKKMVVASSVIELKEKGCVKLSIDKNALKAIVLDIDGTEVDEDEILLLMDKEPMVYLCEGDKWCPPNTGKEGIKSPSLETPQRTVDENPDVYVCSDIEEHEERAPEPFADSDKLSDGTNEKSKPSSPSVFYMKTIKLPVFSPLVNKCLTDGKPELAWNQLIAETANFFYEQLADGGDQQLYRAIGQKMYSAYPCIRMEGSYAWSFFTKGLSQKIRHMRHNLKTKSQMKAGKTASPQAAKRFKCTESPSAASASNPGKSAEEITSHVLQLKEEWRKLHRNRDGTHIKMLLRETLAYRDEYLKSHSKSLLKDVIEEFPCFKDGLYILFEFNIRYGDEKLSAASKAIKRIVATANKMMGKEFENLSEGPNTMIEVLDYLEQNTKFDRSGKRGDAHFAGIINIAEDVDDDKISKHLETKPMVPPHIVVFKNAGIITGIYIVGDTITVKCQGSSVTSALTQLLALYYVFDIDYPKCYAMLLGLLQIFVMNEPFTYDTSKKFKFFSKKFRSVYDSLE